MLPTSAPRRARPEQRARGLGVTSWRGAGTSKRERASTGWSAGTLSEEAMAANELVLSPPISQTPLSDAGVNGVVTAGKEVGDSCQCEERSAEVAEYEESANAVPRQSSARMPKRRSKL